MVCVLQGHHAHEPEDTEERLEKQRKVETLPHVSDALGLGALPGQVVHGEVAEVDLEAVVAVQRWLSMIKGLQDLKKMITIKFLTNNIFCVINF